MKVRQILIAATVSVVVAAPAFAVTGSYTESSMWGDLATDVAAYAGQSFVSPDGGRVLATETGIYEQLAAEQRMHQQEPDGAGVAGPAGPILGDTGPASSVELRTDASIYEQVIAAQRNGGHF